MASSTYRPRGELVDGFRVRNHPLYYVWVAMKARCLNAKCPAYVNYGARGDNCLRQMDALREFRVRYGHPCGFKPNH